jgi:hypothetical protein
LPSITIPGMTGPMAGPPPGPAAAPGPPRTLSIQPRTVLPLTSTGFPRNGENVLIINGGVILTVRSGPQPLLDVEADRVVVWTRGDSPQQLFDQLRTPQGHEGQEVEFYLEGDVVIRSGSGGSETILRAERVYYDVRRNVAVAVEANLELRRRGIPEPLHLRAEELHQVAPTRFEAVRAEVFSSRLPSDPGLKVVMARVTVEDTPIERYSVFGQPQIDPRTGEVQTYTERLMRGEEVVLEFQGVPVFYLPVVQGDANDPLGPLQSLGFKQDRIFGRPWAPYSSTAAATCSACRGRTAARPGFTASTTTAATSSAAGAARASRTPTGAAVPCCAIRSSSSTSSPSSRSSRC